MPILLYLIPFRFVRYVLRSLAGTVSIKLPYSIVGGICLISLNISGSLCLRTAAIAYLVSWTLSHTRLAMATCTTWSVPPVITYLSKRASTPVQKILCIQADVLGSRGQKHTRRSKHKYCLTSWRIMAEHTVERKRTKAIFVFAFRIGVVASERIYTFNRFYCYFLILLSKFIFFNF